VVGLRIKSRGGGAQDCRAGASNAHTNKTTLHNKTRPTPTPTPHLRDDVLLHAVFEQRRRRKLHTQQQEGDALGDVRRARRRLALAGAGQGRHLQLALVGGVGGWGGVVGFRGGRFEG